MTAKKRPSIHSLPAAVYRLFDHYGALLYIGASYDPDARIARHSRKSWGGQIAHTTVTWYDDRPTAFRIETDAIKDEQPLYNKPHRHRGSHMVPMTPQPRELGADIPDDLVAEFMERLGKSEQQVRKLLGKGRERLRRAHAAGPTQKA